SRAPCFLADQGHHLFHADLGDTGIAARGDLRHLPADRLGHRRGQRIHLAFHLHGHEQRARFREPRRIGRLGRECRADGGTRDRCQEPESHRSISPKTMSMVPMIATTSAIMCPFAISSIAARWAKPGARIFMRHGLLAPSDMRKMPNSPLGCSTAAYTSPLGTCMPSLKSLKWWISSSMLSFISARVGGATLWFGVMTGPGFFRSHSMHCFMMRFDWRISSTRTRYRS